MHLGPQYYYISVVSEQDYQTCIDFTFNPTTQPLFKAINELHINGLECLSSKLETNNIWKHFGLKWDWNQVCVKTLKNKNAYDHAFKKQPNLICN